MATIKDFQKLLFPDQPEEWDGIWGNHCQSALDAVLHPVVTSSSIEANADPVDNRTGRERWPLEADAPNFYGHSDGSSKWESENLVTFAAPYDLYMDGQLVRRIRCHKKVATSLELILTRILNLYRSPEALAKAGIDQYDGCYNYRAVRGASHLSMHAYGAAVDFDAAHNALGATHGRMPPEVVAIFKAEGWRWGGDYHGRQDWMHFEACR